MFGTKMCLIFAQKNQIIRDIHKDDWDILKPKLEYIEFKKGALSDQREPNEAYIYFVSKGIFSITHQIGDRDTAIVLLGHDSIIDCSAPFNNGLDGIKVTCLTNLTAQAVPVSVLLALLAQTPSLVRVMASAFRTLFVRLARAAACSQNHTSHQRLASWLLRASDLIENARFDISHQGLADLIGIRRAGVTVELAKLKSLNAISTGYGWIEIKDRAMLEQHACSCYRANAKAFQH